MHERHGFLAHLMADLALERLNLVPLCPVAASPLGLLLRERQMDQQVRAWEASIRVLAPLKIKALKTINHVGRRYQDESNVI